jgi:outer membrane protein
MLMSNRRRAGLLAAACCASLMAGVFSAVSFSEARAETLADAIALAYQTNPTLQQQRASARIVDEGVVQARTGFRPTVSGAADITGSNTNPSGAGADVKVSGSSASVSVSQPLYTGGRATANLSAAEADVLSSRESLRSVEQTVLVNVVQAFVDVRRDQERLRIAKENVAVLQRQLDESNARFDVGEITRTDVAQSQARLAAAKAGLSGAQAQLEVSRAGYAAVVGQTPSELSPEPTLASLLPATVDQAFTAAQTTNPGVTSAKFNEEAAAARVAVAKAGYRPTVAARASLGYAADRRSGIGSQFGDYDRSLTGAITASVPIFTGGLTTSQVRAASERENAARGATESAKRTAIQQVSNAWSNLLASRAQLGSNEEQVRASRIAFEGVRQEQQVGLRTTLDVLNAQLELSNAELALVSARRDEYLASAVVLQAMGQLDVNKLSSTTTAYDPKVSYNRVTHSVGWVPWEPAIEAIDKVGAPSTKPQSGTK